ncbi:uncharacterized protein LOC133842979 [Drosophila sulfurigaster albostrigata]|uniref:uncharacterized protein LOC132792995 n=1 Tax=Drosophila nasuta TaxID=42062 RepID=UPI00295E7C0E|nr:uncharacterized protein LOC132792995 [Drosophila nasuta]XP_062132294.1 uncharacterized protein LOC133842979 [Drosophila sulfurigaster albostrigata]
MFKFIALAFLALVACVAAKPGIVAPLAYSANYVAAAPAAAVYSTEYHGNFASPYVAAPYVASPYVASPYAAAYTAPYTAPLLLRK